MKRFLAGMIVLALFLVGASLASAAPYSYKSAGMVKWRHWGTGTAINNSSAISYSAFHTYADSCYIDSTYKSFSVSSAFDTSAYFELPADAATPSSGDSVFTFILVLRTYLPNSNGYSFPGNQTVGALPAATDTAYVMIDPANAEGASGQCTALTTATTTAWTMALGTSHPGVSYLAVQSGGGTQVAPVAFTYSVTSPFAVSYDPRFKMYRGFRLRLRSGGTFSTSSFTVEVWYPTMTNSTR